MSAQVICTKNVYANDIQFLLEYAETKEAIMKALEYPMERLFKVNQEYNCKIDSHGNWVTMDETNCEHIIKGDLIEDDEWFENHFKIIKI